MQEGACYLDDIIIYPLNFLKKNISLEYTEKVFSIAEQERKVTATLNNP